jgi:drug/metabolite transporter (DMT)-like permease
MAMLIGGKVTNSARGIGAMLSAVFMFSIMDASMKRLSQTYGAFELSCLRCMSSLAFLAVPIAWTGSWQSLRPVNAPLHLVRAALGIIMLGTFVYAVRRLSMAETYSVFLCAPLLMTALSVPLLGERVPRRRWLTIAVGLGGVLIMLRPATTGFASLAAAAAAAAACSYALSAVLVRTLGQTNSSAAMVVWFLLLVGVGSGLLAGPEWRRVPAEDWLWLAAIGLSGALGQYWVTEAFRLAPPAVVAPFEYSALLWAFGIDWAFWAVFPRAIVVTGASIVISCGLIIIWDERRMTTLAQTAAASPPP